MRLLSMSQNLAAGVAASTRYNFSSKNALPKFAPVGRTVALAPVGKPALALSSLFRSQAHEPSEKTSATATFSAGTQSQVLNHPSQRPRLAKGSCRMVQSHLSLDTVKVVCNDLSDADLEVVSAGRPVSTASDKNTFSLRAEQPAATEVAKDSGFRRLVTRWFSSERERA
jgi:hypothetical protein